MEIKHIEDTIPDCNYSRGRKGWGIGLISLHIAEGSYDGTVAWFRNERSGVSSHFVISESGEVTQCVALEDTAYVNGTTSADGKRCYLHATNPIVKGRRTNANNYTVGIEFAGRYNKETGRCPMTAEQESACVDLICHIAKEKKKIDGNEFPVVRSRVALHCEIAPQWKPFCGKGFPVDRIVEKAAEKMKLSPI